jgi:hypothetical protein
MTTAVLSSRPPHSARPRPHRRARRAPAALAGVAVGLALSGAALAAPPNYGLVGTFALPDAGPWDVSPVDGRIYRMSGTDIYRQDAVNGSTYSRVGSLPAGSVNAFGASFIRVAPQGFSMAVGDGNFGAGASVHIVSPAALSPATPTTPQSFAVPNFDGAWLDFDTLIVTGGDANGSYAHTIDLGRSPAAAYRSLSGVGNGSGGVAVGPAGLYVGSGYQPSGEVRSFPASAFWTPTVNPPAPSPFSAGAYVATALSASPLAVDGVGNLIIGGADYSASPPLGGVWVVNTANPAERQFLDPAGGGIYGLDYNETTRELILASGGTAYRFAIPAPGAAGLLAAAGAVAVRRRRRA